MSLNCRALRKKTSQLKSLIEENKIDIVALQETWLNKGDSAIYSEIKEFGFKIAKLERKQKSGGGLAVLSNNQTCQKLSSYYNYKKNGFDNIVCTITINNTKYNIINIYRPPAESKAQFLKDFDDFLSCVMEKEGTFIISGDFNINLIQNDSITKIFQSILVKYDLTQLVKTSTRKSSLLDYIIISSSCSIEASIMSNELSVFTSDHKPLLLKLLTTSPKAKINDFIEIEQRNFKQLELESFKTKLLDSSLLNKELRTSINPESFVKLYDKTVYSILDELCPKKIKRVSIDKSKKWYNKHLREMKRKKRRAERAFLKSPTSSRRKEFKKQKNKYNKLLKQTRTNFFSDKLNQFQHDPKNLHRVLGELMGNKPQKIFPTKLSEEVVAENMGSFYIEKVQKIRQNIILENNGNVEDNESKMFDQEIKQNVIKSKLKSFENISLDGIRQIVLGLKKKYCSLDPCPADVLMQLVDVLCPMYLEFVNKCITEAIFPDQLKYAMITPVIKGPSLDSESYKSYRPLSSLPFLAKIVEKAIYEQIDEHLEVNNLYPNYQSSYRQYHSCETALLKMTDDIQLAIHNKKNVCLLTLDLSAAFDTVDQHILIDKLEKQYNIQDKALKLIKSYFTNRTFSVKINNTISTPKTLLHGVPQGSLLGPLFLCIICIQ